LIVSPGVPGRFDLEKMKIADELKNAQKTLFSFELLPPLRGGNIGSLYELINPLIDFDPLNINITYHLQEAMYKKLKDGLLQKCVVSKRPGTVAIAAAIKYRYPHLEVVPHLICGGFSKSETEDALIDLHYLGIENLMALRGDPPKSQHIFRPEPQENVHAIDLVRQITDLNNGKYLDKEMNNTTATHFSVGVAGYPEKHTEAANKDIDILFLKEKMDAGAEYIITQMFFDNEKFIKFCEKCREVGINSPIVPGLKPIARIADVGLLPHIFNIEIPEALASEIRKCKSDRHAYEIGIEWAIEQSIELKKAGVPALHYFTVGSTDNIKRIAGRVF